jgi:2-polyprenyl-3-methyl-5-hydroxy-6-metoxy-1,4-benzoquinol methylase
MDPNLQEFTNPALYDAENRWDAADDFYLTLAQQVGGPVLDVACGTGRLACAIAQTGLHVTGIDIMPAMLEHARALSPQLPIAWVQADCRTFSLAQQFRCVPMTGHAFQNLLTDTCFTVNPIGGILWRSIRKQRALICHGSKNTGTPKR